MTYIGLFWYSLEKSFFMNINIFYLAAIIRIDIFLNYTSFIKVLKARYSLIIFLLCLENRQSKGKKEKNVDFSVKSEHNFAGGVSAMNTGS